WPHASPWSTCSATGPSTSPNAPHIRSWPTATKRARRSPTESWTRAPAPWVRRSLRRAG
ncbi:MAG: hypothetical protein AVDCRST_MAG89-3541, partial [uncultured Gemmatimonadetes bacterium]